MKRSEINQIYLEAAAVFKNSGWFLPPEPKWDITDFGLGDFENYGLLLVNLAEEKEYCEKLMYSRVNQRTPAHTHKNKKEDIICRSGQLCLKLWAKHPSETSEGELFDVQVNGDIIKHRSGEIVTLEGGERITLVPGIYHEFWPGVGQTIIGEVSTANDDVGDNYFVDSEIGRFPGIDEDEPAKIKLISDD